MSPEHATRNVPAGHAPAGTNPAATSYTPSSIAARITYHHGVVGESPEERYFAATGRWPRDD